MASTDAQPAVAHNEQSDNRGVRFNTDLNQMISPPAAGSPTSANPTITTQSFMEGGYNGQHTANNPFASSTATLVNLDDDNKGWQPGQTHPDAQQIAERLQNTGLHQRRMTLFDYQPIDSTPVSRVSPYPFFSLCLAIFTHFSFPFLFPLLLLSLLLIHTIHNYHPCLLFVSIHCMQLLSYRQKFSYSLHLEKLNLF